MITPQEFGVLTSAIDAVLTAQEELIKDPSAESAYAFTEAFDLMESLLVEVTDTDVPAGLSGACSIQSPKTK